MCGLMNMPKVDTRIPADALPHDDGHRVNVCLYVRMFVCTYVCVYVCLYVCLYVRMFVCTYVCMYVCMYVCLYVCNLFMGEKRSLNPSPHNDDFWRPGGKSLLKTLWEKKKMLVSSIFFFSRNVFHPMEDNFYVFSNVQFVVCKCFQFGQAYNFVVW